MIIHDKKRALMTIMGKRNPLSGEGSAAPMKSERPGVDEMGTPDGRHSAAEDIIRAMESKSPQALMESMANFYDLHMAKASEAPKPTE